MGGVTRADPTAVAAHVPPWERRHASLLRLAGHYVAVSGGLNEPPGAECMACSWANGTHRNTCPVAAEESYAFLLWLDWQLEAGNPALWADLISSTASHAMGGAPSSTLLSSL